MSNLFLSNSERFFRIRSEAFFLMMSCWISVSNVGHVDLRSRSQPWGLVFTMKPYIAFMTRDKGLAIAKWNFVSLCPLQSRELVACDRDDHFSHGQHLKFMIFPKKIHFHHFHFLELLGGNFLSAFCKNLCGYDFAINPLLISSICIFEKIFFNFDFKVSFGISLLSWKLVNSWFGARFLLVFNWILSTNPYRLVKYIFSTKNNNLSLPFWCTKWFFIYQVLILSMGIIEFLLMNSFYSL